jgi:hypothetical protein
VPAKWVALGMRGIRRTGDRLLDALLRHDDAAEPHTSANLPTGVPDLPIASHRAEIAQTQ